MAEFKKHMMYSDGKSKMANTKKQHLNLKAKGWSHTKPKSNSPLDLNQTLVQGAGISNKQYGGATSLSAGEWNGDLMTKPILDAMISAKLTEKESGTTGNTKKKNAGRELNEQNVESIDSKDKNNKTKNTKTKNTKTKKGPKEVNVVRKKGDVFGKLFNPKRYDQGGNKYTESNKTRRGLLKEMKQAKEEFGKDSQEFKDLEKRRNARLYRVKRKGLFNDKTFDDAGLTDFFENEGITDTGPRRSGSRTGKYYSPLDMNSREKYFSKNAKRKNSQGNSPYAYKERVGDNTPFYQVEEVLSTNRRPEEPLQGKVYPEVKIEGNAFDLMEKYGMIDAKKYGNSLNLIGDEKPPQLLGPSASMAIDDFMKVQKDALYKAKTSKKGTSEETAIINNVKQLSANMNTIGDFITETFESTDQETESNGSSVANKYLRDIVFTQKTDEEGRPLTTMMVNNDHGLSIKFRDTEGTYTLDSLKENIFPKAFDSFEMLSKGMSTTKDEAASGMPFNETASKVLINNALKTEEQILSVIHDEESPLYQFLNDFAEGYPSANFDFAHIDSPNYDKEDLAPIVRDYALRKLRRQHSLYSNVKQDINTLSPEEIIKKFS